MIDADWGPPIVAHATVDPEGRTKVLVVAKSLTSNVATTAAALITGAEAFTTTEQTAVTWTINGKGTMEVAECGARGLCDTEAGQCKCFPGYIGLSCSTQASIAM